MYIDIGVIGFEPTAPASQKQCSTKLSYTPKAERVGFEPTDAFTSLVFKTRAINHSTTFPYFISKSSFLTFLFLLSSWYIRSSEERTPSFLVSLFDFTITILDKSSAETLSPVTVIMLGHPQHLACVG